MSLNWEDRCAVCGDKPYTIKNKIVYCKRHVPKEKNRIEKYSGKSHRGIRGGYENE